MSGETKFKQFWALSEDLSTDKDFYPLLDSLGLHRVENLSHTDGAVSLHLYIPAYEECLTFDERSGQARKCKITFWSKYGERTKYQVIT